MGRLVAPSRGPSLSIDIKLSSYRVSVDWMQEPRLDIYRIFQCAGHCVSDLAKNGSLPSS